MWAQKMCLGEKSKPNMLKYSSQKNVFHSNSARILEEAKDFK